MMWPDGGGVTAGANTQRQEWRGCCLPPGVTRLRITPRSQDRGDAGRLRLPWCGQHLDPPARVIEIIKQDGTSAGLRTAVGTWEGLICHSYYCCHLPKHLTLPPKPPLMAPTGSAGLSPTEGGPMVTRRKPVHQGSGGFCLVLGTPHTCLLTKLEASPEQGAGTGRSPVSQCPEQWLCLLHQTEGLPFCLSFPTQSSWLPATLLQLEIPTLEPGAKSVHILSPACDFLRFPRKAPSLRPQAPQAGPGLQR